MSDRRDQNQHWKGVEGHHPPAAATMVFSSGGTRIRTRTGEGFFRLAAGPTLASRQQCQTLAWSYQPRLQ